MEFYSTNERQTEATTLWSLRDVLLMGQAPERGLFMPSKLPKFSIDELIALRGKSILDVAISVFDKLFVDDATFTQQESHEALTKALNFPIPIEPIRNNRYVMRLDQGPTAAFKDVAARVMAQWIHQLLPKNDKLLILVATSGDTGSAVAHAYHGIPGIKVAVLFPKDEVSEPQRKLMTTLGDNITAIAVEGKFDDCQAIAKKALQDPEMLDRLPLTSANSINVGRLLPQMLYYFYAWASLDSDEVSFAVPSGNFGNLMAGLLAKAMGLPVQKFIAAVNENDCFSTFLHTGSFVPNIPSKNCVSNAMNVGHPSNLARIVSLYGGVMLADGSISVAPDLEKMQNDIVSMSVTDAETTETMKKVYDQENILLEPHGAVAYTAAEHFADDNRTPCILLETAHPAKFSETVSKTLGTCPDFPQSMQACMAKPEQYTTVSVDYDAVMGEISTWYIHQ